MCAAEVAFGQRSTGSKRAGSAFTCQQKRLDKRLSSDKGPEIGQGKERRNVSGAERQVGEQQEMSSG